MDFDLPEKTTQEFEGPGMVSKLDHILAMSVYAGSSINTTCATTKPPTESDRTNYAQTMARRSPLPRRNRPATRTKEGGKRRRGTLCARNAPRYVSPCTPEPSHSQPSISSSYPTLAVIGHQKRKAGKKHLLAVRRVPLGRLCLCPIQKIGVEGRSRHSHAALAAV